MKVIYASRTGNVESIVNQLGFDAEDINTVDEAAEDYILFTYTDGAGDIPFEVEDFLNRGGNAAKCRGTVVSGDPGFGEENFCAAGDRISEQFGIECLYKVENAGTAEDLEKIAAVVK